MYESRSGHGFQLSFFCVALWSFRSWEGPTSSKKLYLLSGQDTYINRRKTDRHRIVRWASELKFSGSRARLDSNINVSAYNLQIPRLTEAKVWKCWEFQVYAMGSHKTENSLFHLSQPSGIKFSRWAESEVSSARNQIFSIKTKKRHFQTT
jgi:hypothetical protein